MIDIETEDLIDLRAACREPVFRQKTGKALHISGMYRHVLRGARDANGDRVKLETVRTPSGLRTSREAIGRFIAALTDPDSDIPTPVPAVRRKQIADAEAELAGAGFALG